MRLEEEALKFYRTFVSEKLKAALLSYREVEEWSGIFSSVVTVWLMIQQRINPDHSLAAALEKVQEGWLDSLLSEKSIRVRGSRISNSTGGYSRARSKLSVEAAEVASDTINEAISETHSRQTWQGRRVFAIDGTTLRLSHTEENCRSYPQYKNQHKPAHFPLLLLGLATDVVTGVAMRPAYPYPQRLQADKRWYVRSKSSKKYLRVGRVTPRVSALLDSRLIRRDCEFSVVKTALIAAFNAVFSRTLSPARKTKWKAGFRSISAVKFLRKRVQSFQSAVW